MTSRAPTKRLEAPERLRGVQSEEIRICKFTPKLVSSVMVQTRRCGMSEALTEVGSATELVQ